MAPGSIVCILNNGSTDVVYKIQLCVRALVLEDLLFDL